MDRLKLLLRTNQDWIIERLYTYTHQQGYTRYTSTLKEAWRISVSGLSHSLAQALDKSGGTNELHAEDDYISDPVSEFAILEAQRHRERGVDLGMFLGLLKYYEQAFVDMVWELFPPEDDPKKAAHFVERFFDRLSIGVSVEWNQLRGTDHLRELQSTNRFLTNEKNKYLTIFESLPNPVFFLNTRNNVENVNAAASSFLGRSDTPGSEYYCMMRDRALEHHMEMDADEQDRIMTDCLRHTAVTRILPWLEEDLNAFGASPESHAVVSRRVETSAGPRWMEAHITRMLDISGKFAGTVVVLFDVSERVLAETAVRERERLLQEAERLARVGAWEWDILADRFRFSEQWLQIHGMKQETLSLAELLEIAHPDDRPMLEESFHHSLTSGAPHGTEHRIIKRDTGEICHVRSYGRTEIGHRGDPLLMYGATLDVTTQKITEQFLRQADRFKAVADIASGIAHNFNNLLQVILGAAELGLMSPSVKKDPELAANLHEIVQNAKFGAETVRRLNRFARSSENTKNSAEELFDLGELAAQAIEMTRSLWETEPNLRGAPVHLEARFEPSCLIRGCRTEFLEVMINLLKNAVEALPRGGTILLVTRRSPDMAVFEVHDTGMGIPADHLNRLFTPFFTTSLEAGKGLGLATVQRIVDDHGGTVSVQSTPGEGTVFTVSLPLPSD